MAGTLKKIEAGMYATRDGRYTITYEPDGGWDEKGAWLIRNEKSVPVDAGSTLGECRELIRNWTE